MSDKLPRPLLLTINKIDELFNALKMDNWDSYGAKGLQAHLIKPIITLAHATFGVTTPLPFVGPSNIGGINLEWDQRGKYLVASSLPGEKFSFYYKDNDYEFESEENLLNEESISSFQSYLNRLD
jgi:hypothetical protein